MTIFKPANILIPQVESMEQWSVVACDQYTSQPEYWERVKEYTDGSLSALNLILPEAEIGQGEEKIEQIHYHMRQYLDNGVFREYENAYIYIERTLVNGTIRKGVLGMVDLERYDYSKTSTADIRATEQTVEERIPPRMKIRRDAPIEMPHVLVLCDDEEHMLIESLESVKEQCVQIYDFDLMEGGGRLCGWLVQGETTKVFDVQLENYIQTNAKAYQGTDKTPMVFAVGDGNHSLATAKACYEEIKRSHPKWDMSNHPARYALVELENIHDEAQQFEPIHRIVTQVNADELLVAMKAGICATQGYPITCYVGRRKETIYLKKELGELPVAILQKFLDQYLEKVHGAIDYIHGEDVLKTLASKEHSIGFVLPNIEKKQFFKGIVMDGVLPRKTFSMGHAQEKRYYLEARKIIHSAE